MSRFNCLPAFCNTFVSMEPILEDLRPENHDILFRQVDWIILGAETGRRKVYITEISDILTKMANRNFDVDIVQNYEGQFASGHGRKGYVAIYPAALVQFEAQ
jgi:protein gp37